jgi:hypothetical protein
MNEGEGLCVRVPRPGEPREFSIVPQYQGGAGENGESVQGRQHMDVSVSL